MLWWPLSTCIRLGRRTLGSQGVRVRRLGIAVVSLRDLASWVHLATQLARRWAGGGEREVAVYLRLDGRGEPLHVRPTLSASSGTTLLELVMAGEGIACLADYVTIAPRRQGLLVDILPDQTQFQTQRINVVYYRQTALSQRARLFMHFLAERLPGRYVSA